jgi:tetratricopeptide (TPR) repeat protein
MATDISSKVEQPEAPPRSGDAAALLDLAARAEREGQRAVARQLYEQVLLASFNSLTPANCCAGLLGAARTFQMDGQSDAALDCLEVAEFIATANADHGALGAVLNVRAVVAWQRGDLDGAERLYLIAQQCAEQGGDQRLVAMIAQNRGIIATVRGEFSLALVHYRASLEAYRRLGHVPQLCGVLNNIGMVHTGSRPVGRRGVRIQRSGGRSRRRGRRRDARVDRRQRRGTRRSPRDDFVRARAVCLSSLRRAKKIGDESVEAELLKHLGVVARETGHLADAEKHFDRADSLARARQERPSRSGNRTRAIGPADAPGTVPRDRAEPQPRPRIVRGPARTA